MSERLNKTSICSIVFLDIAEYSQKPVSEQIECKEHFNRLINGAIEDVAQNDRILLDTGDGAAIAFLGSPEEALFVSLTIRDGILKGNEERASAHLFIRIGVNLGPVRVVRDINGQLSIIGDGINVAQRVMSFAEPNQILVSRSYYEIVSRLSEEFTQMFTYSGIKQDKHVREHEVYMIRPSSEHASGVEADHAGNVGTEPAGTIPRNKAKKLVAAGALLALLVGSALMLSRPAKSPIQEKLAPEAQGTVAETKTVASSKPAEVEKSTAQSEVKPTTQSIAAAEKKSAKKPKRSNTASSNKTEKNMFAEYFSSEPAKHEKADNAKSAQHPHQENANKSNTVECTTAQRSLNQCH